MLITHGSTITFASLRVSGRVSALLEFCIPDDYSFTSRNTQKPVVCIMEIASHAHRTNPIRYNKVPISRGLQIFERTNIRHSTSVRFDLVNRELIWIPALTFAFRINMTRRFSTKNFSCEAFNI